MPKSFLRIVSLAFIFIFATALYYLMVVNDRGVQVEEVMNQTDSYTTHVQPIFDNKCIACHSCFNSPCQLNLTSFEGLNRGASHLNVYDFPKFSNRAPTRLYIDGHTTKEWRKKDFFPVVDPNKTDILSYLIEVPPGIESGKQNSYDAEYSRVCFDSTDEDSLKDFTKVNPAGRMPLGFPGLLKEEIKAFQTWRTSGAKGEMSRELEKNFLNNDKLSPLIQKWEKLLNGETLKEKIAARYLYEHLFLASIYFNDHPDIFFRLVRSKTPSGDIDEIGTSFPFDDAGKVFSYRLRPVTNTIVHKTHIPFEFTDEFLKKFDEDFMKSTWSSIPKVMPPYGKEGGNPFKTFKDIPASARYNLFLTNSAYFIMTFIKGPVCRGQTALNVINDHFWVMFLDPKRDVLVNKPQAYKEVSELIEFPSEIGGSFSPLVNFRDRYWKSVHSKFQYLKKEKPLDESAIWNGDKENSNAAITVFRHFDSSSVLRGFRGEIPKTVWVLDYHVFESIYYNLSAGYNVFGPLLHQLNSRLYMEVSRVASEDLFLSFLPNKEERHALRGAWNVPVDKKNESVQMSLVGLLTTTTQEKLSKEYPYEGDEVSSQLKIKKGDGKVGFLEKIQKERLSESQVVFDGSEERGDQGLGQLKRLPGEIVQYLPDSIHILVKDTFSDKLWTLVHNKAHFNVAMLLFEDERRNPKDDSLDVIIGAASSYANLIVVLNNSQIDEFVKDLQNSKNQKEVWSFMQKYALSRSNPKFWDSYNEISDQMLNEETNERGKLDLNRYLNL